MVVLIVFFNYFFYS